jgi:hypothetical protein
MSWVWFANPEPGRSGTPLVPSSATRQPRVRDSPRTPGTVDFSSAKVPPYL